MAVQLTNGDDRDRFIPGMEDEEDDNQEVMEHLFDPENMEMEENDDGSVTILEPEADVADDQDHYRNLAETMDEAELAFMADDILNLIEQDKKSREQRDKQYKEGIERAGLTGENASGGADFDGASKAVHPALAEACVDYAAATMRELMPAEGPAKPAIQGTYTAKKTRLAERQAKLMNWQMTTDVTEFSTELEQLMTQVPAGGSQFIKFWNDQRRKRWTCEFVPIDYVHIPYACSDFYTAHRVTHEMHVTQQLFEDNIEQGFWRDIANTGAPATVPDTSAAADAAAKVEGVSKPSINEDGLRTVYEVKIDYRVKQDGNKVRPYLVTIDDHTGKVLSVYRNWEQEDPTFEPIHWMVEFGLVPWRGAYKIGLYHLIGGLSIAATGALRALLDSAHANNAATALALKGKGIGGQNINPTIGQIAEVNAPPGVDDIRKVAMPMPFNPPSQVLYLLLGWLTDQMKGVLTTAEEKIQDASNNMPVGTALALIEQGQKVMSSIMGRNYKSMNMCLAIIKRLNATGGVTIEHQMRKLGEVLATPEDFKQPLAVCPVADPRIFTEAQRFAQFQTAMALAQNDPTFDMYELKQWGLQTAKIPKEIIEKIHPKPQGPSELNPIAENAATMFGRPILAFPEQDHLAHIEAHMRFAMDPMMGAAPWAMNRVMPNIMEHIVQHVAFYYAQVCHDLAEEAAGVPLGDLMKDEKNGRQVDALLATASKLVHAGLRQQLGPVYQPLMQMYQMVQQMKPPPMMDPAQAQAMAAQATMKEVERKGAKDQQDFAKWQQEQQRTQAKDQQAMALDQAREQRESAETQARLALDAEAQANQQRLEEARLALSQREMEVMAAFEAGKLDLEQQALELQAIADARQDEKETLKLAAQLKEDSQPGNQLSGV